MFLKCCVDTGVTPGKASQKQNKNKKELTKQRHQQPHTAGKTATKFRPGQFLKQNKKTPSQSLLSEGKNQIQSCYNILTKTFSIQQKIFQTFKETRKCDPYYRKKEVNRNCL